MLSRVTYSFQGLVHVKVHVVEGRVETAQLSWRSASGVGLAEFTT